MLLQTRDVIKGSKSLRPSGLLSSRLANDIWVNDEVRINHERREAAGNALRVNILPGAITSGVGPAGASIHTVAVIPENRENIGIGDVEHVLWRERQGIRARVYRKVNGLDTGDHALGLCEIDVPLHDVENVRSGPTVDDVIGKVPDENVVAVSAYQHILAGPAIQNIVAETAVEVIVAAAGQQEVVARTANQDVAASTALKTVIAGTARLTPIRLNL